MSLATSDSLPNAIERKEKEEKEEKEEKKEEERCAVQTAGRRYSADPRPMVGSRRPWV
jgi:hypothetical protein